MHKKLNIKQLKNFFYNKRVAITGHTGFKGIWLSSILKNFGAKVYGFSLADNIGLITAYANDTNYDNIFKGQLQSVLDQGDLLIAISGSGNSKNVINAVDYANEMNANTIGIVGFDGGELIKKAKFSIHVPSYDMQICEDIHLTICHLIMKKLCSTEIVIK